MRSAVPVTAEIEAMMTIDPPPEPRTACST
jgi:hypothetical protein